uniref:Allantoicase domain-containing protein n=1 Tax=Chromera velia CCMP2878 TaxID=1169474 RepID=A0A0G4GZJ8_9ALVE|eukprot:Cvel_24043.t1-p1 / transcript=Cvel_24043.t1 / gene=Cvel_24043 / organism=Chromera_velia_CCMP2878 / gene_product=Allantoicase, putative / transcript_product=Allantoicase, putative / location=Cvel_scaffold2555:240-1595(-) / protein_length=452 / sequence_SO=supercontig / SO=protein_coding / is_pseudo=false
MSSSRSKSPSKSPVRSDDARPKKRARGEVEADPPAPPPPSSSIAQSGGASTSILSALAAPITGPFKLLLQGKEALQSAFSGPKASGHAPDFTTLTDLSSETFGGEAVFATDEWFACAHNLLSPEDPVWKEGEFTSYGKWMDGWETRRKRIPGHDWCVIRLGLPGTVRGLELSTRFFTGNNVPAASVWAINCPDLEKKLKQVRVAGGAVDKCLGKMGTCASPEAIEAVDALLSSLGVEWVELMPQTRLGPGYAETCKTFFEIPEGKRGQFTHLRLNAYPDGGIARLRVYGEVAPSPSSSLDKEVDLALCTNGGVALAWSDQHYGIPPNMLLPTVAPNMGNGWETARKKERSAVLVAGPDGTISNFIGDDWALFKLAGRGTVHRIVVDTKHFKGNFPESCKVEGIDRPDLLALDVLTWVESSPPSSLVCLSGAIFSYLLPVSPCYSSPTAVLLL